MNAKRPKVSVIVPSHNSVNGLMALLERLQEQTLDTDDFEVILVDDGSTDGTQEAVSLQHAWVKLIRSSQNGAYRARSVGVAASQGQWLAFTDADCLPKPDWLERGLSEVQHQGWDIAAGAIHVVLEDRRSIVERYDSRFNLKQEFYATRLGFGATANLFVSRAIYERAEGFNTSLYSGGDQLFCQKVTWAGGRFGYLADAIVWHPTRKTRKELLIKTRRVAKGRAHSFPTRRYYLPRLLSYLPPAYQDSEFRTEKLGFKIKFALLHYWLECARIHAYLTTRFSMRLQRNV
jgi:glycosyltransferase involved in cell wall biosynthesis